MSGEDGTEILLGRQTLSTKKIQEKARRTTSGSQTKTSAATSEPKPKEHLPAPGDQDYERITKKSPVQEVERQAQLKYSAQKSRLEQETETTTPEVQVDEDPSDQRARWVKTREPIHQKGIVKEAAEQIPQVSSAARRKSATKPTTKPVD